MAGQKMPDGWDWQWLVQEDGQDGLLLDQLPDDPRILPGSGRPGGPGVARTLALARAEGDLVKVLDADDQLTLGALARDIAVLTENPHLGWTTSRVLDLLPDGTTQGFDQDPPDGPISRGAVLAFWKANGHRAQVHPATLCLRRDLLLALGGWMALPASEDTGLLIAASVITEGYFTAETGLLYRKWPGQATSQPAHREPAEHSARMRIIEARAYALRALLSAR
nr:glycosyltransferase family A protein [Plantactinospora mayteni]